MSKFMPRLRFPEFRIPMADFKGHHVKALARIGQLAPQIDLVLEVRDARAPLSTRNVLFDRALQGIERIVLYLKKDCSSIDTRLLDRWHEREQYMFVDCRRPGDARFLVDLAKQRHAAMRPPPPLGLRMLVIGMPNVGKSTLVNSLRSVGLASGTAEDRIAGPKQKRKVARTGGMPGVTRATSEVIRVSRSPSILLYDTPGVSLPRASDSETMIVLSLVGSIAPTYVDPVVQADYLLFVMNLQEPLGKMYRQYLDAPTNDITKLLRAVAKKTGKANVKSKFLAGRTFDETGAAIHWVDRWRQGKEGRVVFDTEAIPRYNSFMKRVVDYNSLGAEEKQRVDSMDIALNRGPAVDGLGRPKAKSYRERQMDKQNVLFSHKRWSE